MEPVGSTASRLCVGMIGGGEGAFIGAVHRTAMRIDGRFDLVAGAFSRDAERSARSGAALGLDPDRCYPSYAAMIEAEAEMGAGGLDAVAVVTPNDTHADAATLAARAGLHVLCDKPATRTLGEALALQDALAEADVIYGLAHAYLGYPLIAEARARVLAGELGEVRRVAVAYPQGWLAAPDDSPQAAWRTDPERAGLGGATGDIGTHAFNLAEFVGGRRVEALAADIRAAVPGRRLDDDAAALLRFEGGARGTLICSQVCAGEENGLRLDVWGERASLSWRQEEPNTLVLRAVDAPTQLIRAGQNAPGLRAETGALFRTPMGHPEGYLEAFAGIYRAFADAILSDGTLSDGPSGHLPGIKDGVRGMAFVEAMVASSRADAAWVRMDDVIEGGRR